ncbi:hypothetical protein [Vibrio mangrovi]|uniref:Uncharacterized protein n=1 Tax=Vibrio mangrovi TaxID=474394 RepID=A0A1Y6IXI1_9VIBR|nr:hypothetical protein [Vibrio mangrovi]MDW6002856.1 hypothetical protein [Vibrio mangrovi]SMS02346.1 hypothetical protein VIM7927_03667 [Vibrio mangrovi]
MRKKDSPQSLWKKVSTYFVIINLAGMFLLYPIYYVIHIIALMATDSPVVELSFIVMLLFNLGVGGTVYFIFDRLLKNIANGLKIENLLYKLNLIMLNVTVFSPFVLIFFSDAFMSNYHYMNCKEMAVTGKLSKNIYTRNQEICELLIKEKETQ